MHTSIHSYFEDLRKTAFEPDEARAAALKQLIDYITEKQRSNETARLNFICTHNARRSHMSQILAAGAAVQADLENIECYSGGTEITRIHPNAKAVLEDIGFDLAGADEGDNPNFLVDLGEANLIEVFSKKFDDDPNPTSDFAAVMVCSAADAACPFVPGADARILLTFEDPKEFDNDEDPIPGYRARADQIARELLYVMDKVSDNLS